MNRRKLTYERMGGALRNHSNTKFDRVTVYIVSVTRPSNLDCFNERGVAWGGGYAYIDYIIKSLNFDHVRY